MNMEVTEHAARDILMMICQDLQNHLVDMEVVKHTARNIQMMIHGRMNPLRPRNGYGGSRAPSEG